MTNQAPDYMAFLLRLWRVDETDRVKWRASLEEPSTGERRGFADIDRLCTFLEEQCSGAGDQANDSDGRRSQSL
jgi:hypothetical protein